MNLRYLFDQARRGLAWEHNRVLTHELRDSAGYNTKLGLLWIQIRRMGRALREWARRSLWNELIFGGAALILVLWIGFTWGANRAEARGSEAKKPLATEASDRVLPTPPDSMQHLVLPEPGVGLDC